MNTDCRLQVKYRSQRAQLPEIMITILLFASLNILKDKLYMFSAS